MEEITDTGIVAIAVNHFVDEVVAVMLEFLFYIGQLRIKLIFLRVLCFVQVPVFRRCCHFQFFYRRLRLLIASQRYA